MEAGNLTPDNVKRLTDLFEEMKKENPGIYYNFWPEVEQPATNREQISIILNALPGIYEQIDRLDQKLDRIFGNHALINGQWHKI